MNVLVVNCGSSSIKFQMYEMPDQRVLAKGQAQRIGENASVLDCQVGERTAHLEQPIADHKAGMNLILETLKTQMSEEGQGEAISIAAVGHRVVHGGEAFTGSVLINDDVEETIQQCADLAPLHNPANLTGIRASSTRSARCASHCLFRHGISRIDSQIRVSVRIALRDV